MNVSLISHLPDMFTVIVTAIIIRAIIATAIAATAKDTLDASLVVLLI